MINVFETLKTDVANSAITVIENDIPFCIETDTLDSTIALTQSGYPVVFFHRNLCKCTKTFKCRKNKRMQLLNHRENVDIYWEKF